ncbi:high affinity nitrate transporter 2.5-like [Beta vulgaris subsp. vulgaris]|uniref:high affinity nitrate transporter 2.5-like n=1 Tax=Beta vulgaris subsp. vulgaris TaxID=3555 RepID=UPI0020372CB0|nr:high affinity nitrate transporter 2.5-like [Beta vulgaris subsp. vulgaris]
MEELDSKKFSLPVDAENKATIFPLFSVAKPHMRAFYLSWLQFFACFISTFAAPPLLPIIRDNLNLTVSDIGNAGIASVSGSVFARLAMGTACDLVGPRVASASLTLLTAPAVYLSAIVDSPTAFLLARFFTGFSLATFVSTQFWMSSMFSPPVVGRANGVAAGWGNLGGGATQMIMPLVYTLILRMGPTKFTAWRIAFFIPAALQTVLAFAVMLFGQDMPDGNFQQLHKSGDKYKDSFSKVIYHGLTNYRGWITALCYGYCFGVELTVDNIIAQYFYDRFDLNLHTAGIIAASFGLSNVFARPGGGMVSDLLAKKFGMRGRLWGWWIIQTIAGVLCIVLGLMNSLSGSIVVMLVFSVFVQAACGLAFGVVPFVSRRALGVISGMTGAGGNVGAVITQLIFFKGSQYTIERGITYMGVMIVACTLPIALIYFPQWGGMLCDSQDNFTEEEYYSNEWDLKEQQHGHHQASLKFACSSRS